MRRTATFVLVARGCAKRAGSAARLVGVRDPDRTSYWFYMTNATPDALGAGELAQLYVCRRQIGLVFKELKSHYRLGELPTRNAPVVEALLLLSIMTFLLCTRQWHKELWKTAVRAAIAGWNASRTRVAYPHWE